MKEELEERWQCVFLLYVVLWLPEYFNENTLNRYFTFKRIN